MAHHTVPTTTANVWPGPCDAAAGEERYRTHAHTPRKKRRVFLRGLHMAQQEQERGQPGRSLNARNSTHLDANATNYTLLCLRTKLQQQYSGRGVFVGVHTFSSTCLEHNLCVKSIIRAVLVNGTRTSTYSYAPSTSLRTLYCGTCISLLIPRRRKASVPPYGNLDVLGIYWYLLLELYLKKEYS